MQWKYIFLQHLKYFRHSSSPRRYCEFDGFNCRISYPLCLFVSMPFHFSLLSTDTSLSPSLFLSLHPFSLSLSFSAFSQSWLRWEYNLIASVHGLNRRGNPSSRLNEKVLLAILLLKRLCWSHRARNCTFALYDTEKKRALNDEE